MESKFDPLEIEQIHANTGKLMAETMKLQAEASKLNRERSFYPVVILTGLLSAGLGVAGALVTLWVKMS